MAASRSKSNRSEELRLERSSFDPSHLEDPFTCTNQISIVLNHVMLVWIFREISVSPVNQNGDNF